MTRSRFEFTFRTTETSTQCVNEKGLFSKCPSNKQTIRTSEHSKLCMPARMKQKFHSLRQ